MEMLLRELQRQQAWVNPTSHLQELLASLRPHFALTDITSPLLRHNLQQHMISDVFKQLSVTSGISEILKQHTSLSGTPATNNRDRHDSSAVNNG